jgi:hypothetical protein
MDATDIGPADFTISREVDGETLVLDARTDLVHRLNSTASFIWQRSQSGASSKEIAAEIADSFEIDLHEAALDVDTTLARLKELNLVADGWTPAHRTTGMEQHEQV